MAAQYHWTQEEIDYVKANYRHMTAVAMGKVLGRTFKAVQVIMAKNGLYKRKQPPPPAKQFIPKLIIKAILALPTEDFTSSEVNEAFKSPETMKLAASTGRILTTLIYLGAVERIGDVVPTSYRSAKIYRIVDRKKLEEFIK